MGRSAFQLLKSGENRPESPKQAEIHLASLLKILSIGGWQPKPPGWRCRMLWLWAPDFCRIWLIPGNRRLCYPDHSLQWENGAVCCMAMQGIVQPSIGFWFYTRKYIKPPDPLLLAASTLLKSTRNTSAISSVAGKNGASGLQPTEITQARDGFALHRAVIRTVP